MGIPAIRPYAMPDEADLPANVATWRPDPDRAVLLIHDMQRYFVDFFPPGDPVETLVANIGRIRQVAAGAGIPVVYTAQPGAMTREERGLLYDVWGPGMGDDARYREIVEPLTPGDGDVVLTKWRYSAFHRSRLEDVIRGAGRDQLLICGVYAHVGCLMTACDAFTRDIQPFLVADAVADFTAQDHRMAVEYAAQRCAVAMCTARLLRYLRAGDLQPTA